MNEVMNAALEYTLLTCRFKPNDNLKSLIVFSTINTAIRGAMLYATIRLVMTAVDHGSF